MQLKDDITYTKLITNQTKIIKGRERRKTLFSLLNKGSKLLIQNLYKILPE